MSCAHVFRTPRMVNIDNDDGIANDVAETGKDPCSIYLSTVDAEHVRRAIQQLSPDLREIILMREFEYMSYQEIAKVLGSPLGTVMSRLARARSKLRSSLAVALQVPDPTSESAA